MTTNYMTAGDTRSFVAPTVETCDYLANPDNEWVSHPRLRLESYRKSLGNSMSRGLLSYNYGAMHWTGGPTEPQVESYLAILGHLARVTVTDSPGGTFQLYGYIVDSNEALEGNEVSISDGGAGTIDDIESGAQQFNLVGVEWWLQRETLMSSRVARVDKDEQQQDVFTIIESIGEGLVFNRRRDGQDDPTDWGNMHPTIIDDKNPDGYFDFVHAFEGNQRNRTLWDAEKIVRYVCAMHNQQWHDNVRNRCRMEIVIDPSSVPFLSWYTPHDVQAHGRTYWDILNQVIDRRRGLIWWLDGEEVSPQDMRWRLYVKSTTPTAVALADGTTIPANDDQVDIGIGDAISVRDPSTVREDTSRKYDYVICVGDRIGVVFTLDSIETAARERPLHLIPNWTVAGEQKYRDALALHDPATYNGLTRAQKEKANDNYRRDESIRDVFRTFVLNPDWDGFDPQLRWPFLDSFDNQVGYSYADLRFESYLPLLRGYDYSEDPENPTNETGTVKKRYVEPLVLLPYLAKMPDAAQEQEVVGYFGNRQANSFHEQDDLAGGVPDFSISVQMLEDNPGMDINVQQSMQHRIAFPDEFLADESPNSNAEPSAVPKGYYDPTEVNNVKARPAYATVYVRNHVRVTGVYPPLVAPTPQQLNLLNALVIDVGPRAKYDYILPETIIGYRYPKAPDDDGNTDGLIRTPLNNGNIAVLRDDRKHLTSMAEAAWVWYGTTRNAMQLPYREILQQSLGQFIKGLVDGVTLLRTVNTAVSSVEYNFEEGSTVVRTDWQEIDFGGQVFPAAPLRFRAGLNQQAFFGAQAAGVAAGNALGYANRGGPRFASGRTVSRGRIGRR